MAEFNIEFEKAKTLEKSIKTQLTKRSEKAGSSSSVASVTKFVIIDQRKRESRVDRIRCFDRFHIGAVGNDERSFGV